MTQEICEDKLNRGKRLGDRPALPPPELLTWLLVQQRWCQPDVYRIT